MTLKQHNMTFEEIQEKRGLVLTPSNWINLNGAFSPAELEVIAKKVRNNFTKIANKHPKTRK